MQAFAERFDFIAIYNFRFDLNIPEKSFYQHKQDQEIKKLPSDR